MPQKAGVGLEIKAGSVRLAAVEKNGGSLSVLASEMADLPPGMVSESYTTQNINDPDGLTEILRDCLGRLGTVKTNRVSLSLPDTVFRVQTLEFDQLPPKAKDRERLIRWRLEKAAAFDTSDTILRYQILRRQDKGFTLLACSAKRDVIAQYESLLLGLGFEPWSVGLSSFHIVDFYSGFILHKAPVSAIAYITSDAFSTFILEGGGLRFYRFKEMKRGTPEEIRSRLVREIDDSLHFYTHMDRSQIAEVGNLYLSGDSVDLVDALVGGLSSATSLDVQVLSPAVVQPVFSDTAPELAAALGAGGTL